MTGRKLTADEIARNAANMTRGRQEAAERRRLAKAEEVVAAAAPRRRERPSGLPPAYREPVALPADASDATRLRRLTGQYLVRLEEIARLPIEGPETVRALIGAAGLVISSQIKVDDSSLRERERVDRILELLEALKPGLSAGLVQNARDAGDDERDAREGANGEDAGEEPIG